jgi:hypothetical protein
MLLKKPVNLKSLSGAVNLNAESSSDNRVKVLGMVLGMVRGKATAFGPAVEYSKAVEYRMNKLWSCGGAL